MGKSRIRVRQSSYKTQVLNEAYMFFINMIYVSMFCISLFICNIMCFAELGKFCITDCII